MANMQQSSAQYRGTFDGIEVSFASAPIEVESVRGLEDILGRVRAEGASATSLELRITPHREVYPNGLDRVLLPADALRDGEGKAPGHLMLIRDGDIRTWVAREDVSDEESFYRLPVRHQDAVVFQVVAVTWHEAPAAQFDRLRYRRGQPSMGAANTGGCDDDCLDSNPFDFSNRLRTWNEGNYKREPSSGELLSQTPTTFWGTGTWKGLLVLHGTALQSHLGLRHLDHATVKTICEKYGDRVIALDHKTLDNTVAQNVRELLDRMPQDKTFKLDILAISRGALVARYLAEGHANAYMASRGQQIEVRHIVFVGGANDGTPSAGKPGILNGLDNLKVAKCMACRKCFSADKPNTKCCDSIELAELDSAIGVLLSDSGLQGQKDLREGSAMVELINRRNPTGGAALPSSLKYFAIAGEYACNNTNKKGCVCNIGAIFDGETNDLVITLDSVTKPKLGGDDKFKNGANRFPVSGDRLLKVSKPHSELFLGSKVSTKLIDWLNGDL